MKVPASAARKRGETLFVTGTDTSVGKTSVACALLRLARAEGIKACGWKPVASGCESKKEGLRNADALALQKAAGTAEPYEILNPYAFEPAIAPNLAATAAGRHIRTAELDRVHAGLARDYELIVVEGAGGWMTPLDEQWTFAAWVAEREWPVLLVVGLRLGCLNHALLSAEAISRRARLAGWVASELPPAMASVGENVADLRRRLSAPFWGRLPPGAGAFEELESVRKALRGVLRQSSSSP